jgi:peptidoglycan/LPS O-acetylase OafA/YrhL
VHTTNGPACLHGNSRAGASARPRARIQGGEESPPRPDRARVRCPRFTFGASGRLAAPCAPNPSLSFRSLRSLRESPAPPSAPKPRLSHLPALDGLRGLAVLGVLLFHDGRLAGGYLGVDLFFVLSGFLITANLLAEHAGTGRINLRAFWMRRARRLFPALLALVFFVGTAAPLCASPEARARIRADGLATLGYVANWHAIFSGRSYWDLFAAPSPFEHAWSLAIEEQFYIVWPLLSFVVLRAPRPRLALGFVAGILTLASAAALARVFVAYGSSRAYLGTDTRAAAILAGAALACALHGRDKLKPGVVRSLDAIGVASLLGLALAWARLDGHQPFLFRGGLWLSEIAVLVLIACATQGRASFMARLFAFRPLVWVGLVSYGVYLVHWPLFTALPPGRFGLHGAALSALRFTLTFALAAASFRWL